MSGFVPFNPHVEYRGPDEHARGFAVAVQDALERLSFGIFGKAGVAPTFVNSLNGGTGVMSLAAGTGISLSGGGSSTITVDNTGVLTVNTFAGAVQILAGSNVTITNSANQITINASGGGGTGTTYMGDGTWINVSGTTITHIGPGPAAGGFTTVAITSTSLDVTFTPVVVVTDATGHVVSMTNDAPTTWAPSGFLTGVTGDGFWTSGSGSTVSHIGPHTATNHDPCGTVSASGGSLTITLNTHNSDDKGHRTSPTTGSAVTFSPTNGDGGITGISKNVSALYLTDGSGGGTVTVDATDWRGQYGIVSELRVAGTTADLTEGCTANGGLTIGANGTVGTLPLASVGAPFSIELHIDLTNGHLILEVAGGSAGIYIFVGCASMGAVKQSGPTTLSLT